jgi:hypothetical protein
VKQILRWIKEQFDETDLILVAGLSILYFGLQHPAVPTWIPPAVVGGVLVSIACLGYWRGKG